MCACMCMLHVIGIVEWPIITYVQACNYNIMSFHIQVKMRKFLLSNEDDDSAIQSS